MGIASSGSKLQDYKVPALSSLAPWSAAVAYSHSAWSYPSLLLSQPGLGRLRWSLSVIIIVIVTGSIIIIIIDISIITVTLILVIPMTIPRVIMVIIIVITRLIIIVDILMNFR